MVVRSTILDGVWGDGGVAHEVALVGFLAEVDFQEVVDSPVVEEQQEAGKERVSHDFSDNSGSSC